MPHYGKPKRRRNKKRDLTRDRIKSERSKKKIKPVGK